MNETPRLRMFAGPNGSGKTTIKNGFDKPADWFGIYINPDELEKSIREQGCVSLASFPLKATTEELRDYFAHSALLQLHGLDKSSALIQVENQSICFPALEINSYIASVLADFLRRKAIAARRSFSFETVMSSSDKIELLRTAQEQGYRTYLYYVATESPEINVARVNVRVKEGGHSVPKEKVIARYHRSLALLLDAIRCTNRAFLFDTSESESWYFAEITDGLDLELKSEGYPDWFQTAWKQF